MTALGPTTRWRVVNGLGVYVLMMYGIAYYAVTTVAPRMADDFGVGVSTIFALFSVSLLASSVISPLLGRWTDQVGPGTVLVIGAMLRSLALVLMATAPDILVFAVAMLVVQILSQATEYDATFAAAVHATGDGARVAISQITLWGGIASTLSWPATAFLLDCMNWRHVILLYAVLLAAVCVPIAWFIRHATLGLRAKTSVHTAQSGTNPGPSMADARFVVLAAAFAFGGIAYTLPALMLPVLEGLGLGASGIIAGMIFGPAQTAGRFSEMLFGQRHHPIIVAVAAAALVVISLAILLVAQGPVTAIAFALLFGAGAGVGYVVRGSVVLSLYGPAQYASWLGRLATVRLIVSAAGPLVLTLILESFGAHGVVVACALAGTVSLACFVLLRAINRS